MKYNSRSIYGCTMAEPEFTAPQGCILTQSEDEKRLYVHIMDYPFRDLEVKGLAEKVEYMQFLHDGSELIYSENKNAGHEGNIVVKLPVVKPNILYPTIEIFLK